METNQLVLVGLSALSAVSEPLPLSLAHCHTTLVGLVSGLIDFCSAYIKRLYEFARLLLTLKHQSRPSLLREGHPKHWFPIKRP